MVSGSSTITAVKDQVSSNLGEEAVILDPKSGYYYGLNDVGSLVWHLIQAPKTVSEIGDAILNHYQVEPEECLRDLVELLEDLQSRGLIEVH